MVSYCEDFFSCEHAFFFKTHEGLADIYWFLIVFLCDIMYVFTRFMKKRNYGFALCSIAMFVGISILGRWIDSFLYIVKLYVLYVPFYFFWCVLFSV